MEERAIERHVPLDCTRIRASASARARETYATPGPGLGVGPLRRGAPRRAGRGRSEALVANDEGEGREES